MQMKGKTYLKSFYNLTFLIKNFFFLVTWQKGI